MPGTVRIGTSGWVYPPWRGVFYPQGLPQRDELSYLSRRVTSVEINGSFYSLQKPDSYRKWYDATPDGFTFAVKGPRFITHMKRLRDAGTPLANFFASGVLALREKLGPVLWQTPATLPFDPDVLDTFLGSLPRTTEQAAALSEHHDERLTGRSLTTADADRPLRHALEPRHPSFASPDLVALLRHHGVALVVADTAGTWPRFEDVTADFVYARLHGDAELYASGYTPPALDDWAQRIRTWQDGGTTPSDHTSAPPPPPAPEGRDVYCYFDNDMKVKAPADAQSLAARLTPAHHGTR
ncbi:DUF72 domain-containing protein [Actinokineospora bangkokensis]|uniref:DUF72 domain-containing protein n=1 Tax=Actinokineospora bangkokensis TaxID=1193682 RepID=A0A1Q9LSF1_9PSEU|nr:DUF72 domain-containing protein [Actinokineospora bangkokensis]OLR94962.1 hypothetical protein BJP25_08290 [Actinokineospora bangkokensis]